MHTQLKTSQNIGTNSDDQNSVSLGHFLEYFINPHRQPSFPSEPLNHSITFHHGTFLHFTAIHNHLRPEFQFIVPVFWINCSVLPEV